MLGRVLPLPLLLIPVLSGCLAPLTPTATEIPHPLSLLRFDEEDRLEVEVPVPVILVGFPPGTAAALQARLAEPVRIDQNFLNIPVQVPPDVADEAGGRTSEPMPIVPLARWEVSEAEAGTADAFWAAVAAAPAAERMFDGNLAEAWLAERFPPDPSAPTLFLLHAGDRVGEHGWRYTWSNGYLENVRLFGEREPLGAFDLSAREDPFVTTTSGVPRLPVSTPVYVPLYSFLAHAQFEPVPVERAAYNYPVDATADGLVDLLAELTSDATHFRLLQGSIYPVATKPCHAVTLILAIRGTSTSEYVAGAAADHVDVAGLDDAFNNLTGQGRTFTDFKLIRLPHEDPVLDAMIPRHPEQLDLFRYWMDQNWETYWVARDGCEPYVSLVVSGDMPEMTGFSGIAMNGLGGTHRISFSVVSDHHRIRETWEGPAKDTVNNGDRGIGHFDRFNRLLSHETGHLMGQRHPHDVYRDDAGLAFTPAFSSITSAMSYQIRFRSNDFGAIDQNNHARNGAAFALAAAHHEGLEGTPEFAEALDLLTRRQWRAAADVLIPLLDAGHDAGCRRTAMC